MKLGGTERRKYSSFNNIFLIALWVQEIILYFNF